MTQDINVLALVKGTERYVFLYDDSSRAETLRVLGRFASNPELSFTWYDAAVLSQKIRQESAEARRCERASTAAGRPTRTTFVSRPRPCAPPIDRVSCSICASNATPRR